jgi:hypothetical protein
MPDVTGLVPHWTEINDPAGGSTVICDLKDLKPHPGRVLTEQSKIEAVYALICSPRHGASCENVTALRRSPESVGFILFDSRFSHRAAVRNLNNPASIVVAVRAPRKAATLYSRATLDLGIRCNHSIL